MVARTALYFPDGGEVVLEVDLWDWTDDELTMQQVLDLAQEGRRMQAEISARFERDPFFDVRAPDGQAQEKR